MVGLEPATLQIAVKCFNHLTTSQVTWLPCSFSSVHLLMSLIGSQLSASVLHPQWDQPNHWRKGQRRHWRSIRHPYLTADWYVAFPGGKYCWQNFLWSIQITLNGESSSITMVLIGRQLLESIPENENVINKKSQVVDHSTVPGHISSLPCRITCNNNSR